MCQQLKGSSGFGQADLLGNCRFWRPGWSHRTPRTRAGFRGPGV